MDISIILGKLDSGAYATYEAFLSDFRLVFNNAIAYNRVHMNTDPIGKSIYDKAMFCKDLVSVDEHLVFLTLRYIIYQSSAENQTKQKVNINQSIFLFLILRKHMRRILLVVYDICHL